MACTPHSIHIRRLNSLLNYIDELRHSVNFQIEHYLFPTMPQFRQGEVGTPAPTFQRQGFPTPRSGSGGRTPTSTEA